MNGPNWPTAAVAIAFIALVGVMFWRATDSNFAEVWAGVGSVVGVITGAIPSFFFSAEARRANQRAETLAAFATPDQVEGAHRSRPDLFR